MTIRVPRPYAVSALLLAFALLAPAGASAAKLYGTDRCVSDKLRALSRACQQVLGAQADFARRQDQNRVDQAMARARLKLAKAWGKAEKKVRGEVDCAETTRSSAEVARIVEDAAAAIAAGVFDGVDLEQAPEQRCTRERLRGARDACRALLRGESQHMRRRDRDRDRAGLEAERARAEAELAQEFVRPCGSPATSDDVMAQLEEGVREALEAVTVSPAVDDTQFVRVVPPEEVRYNGRRLEAECWDGAEYSFWVKRGTVNKLLMYYQGGGACWNFLTCSVPTFKNALGPDDNPDLATSGFADRDNPENPFRDWHIVVVPYCTGDIHWGDNAVVYQGAPGQEIEVRHKGFVNAQVAEKWVRDHFVQPEHVFVTGSSAGAYGAVAASGSLLEFAYPSTVFSVLGDAGNGVVTQDFLVNDLGNWGLEKNLPEWIPALNVPLEQLDLADAYVELANTYPGSRFATYTSAYDGSQGGQSGFYAIMLAGGSPFAALQWWEASCAWNEQMRAQNADAQARATNFRSYVGTGSRHTMWGSDKVYTDTTGGVPTIADWVHAMIDGTAAWVNVECADCGVTLPGDPKPPALPTEPFDVDGNIVCPAP